MTEDSSWIQDGTVVEVRFIVVIAEIKMASSAAPCFGFVQVASVAVNLEAHVARVKAYGGFWVDVAIVEQLVDVLVGQVGGLALA